MNVPFSQPNLSRYIQEGSDAAVSKVTFPDGTSQTTAGDPTKIEDGNSKMEIASDGACVFTPNGSANTTTFATDGDIATTGDVIIPQVYAADAPSKKLLFKDESAGIFFGDAGINYVGGPSGVDVHDGSHLNFFTNDTSRLNITRAGNVGIPTPISTTDYTAKLAVNGGLYVDGAQGIRLPRTFNLDPGERTWRITQSSDSPGGTVNDLMFHYIFNDFVETGKIRFKRGGNIISSGTVTANGTVLTSDDRIKENEKLIVNATETLSKLTPQIYDKYQSMDLSGSSTIESGLIAQEVYYNAPELRHLVVVGKDYDASGNEYTQTPEEMDLSGVDIANDPDYGSHGWSKTEQSGLHYNGLIPYLIKSNQELAERLAALENK